MGYKVYVHTFPNGKKYVGITKQQVERRWRDGKAYKENKRMWNAIKKYGWQNIKHEVIADGLSADEAASIEIQLISDLSLLDISKGYNNAPGGTHPQHTEKTREKIGKASKGRLHSEEFKLWISERNSGKNNFMFGKHHTEETKRKISQAKKGHCVSPNKGKFGSQNPTARCVISIDPTSGEEKRFGSIKEAADTIKRRPSGIQAVLHGEQRVCGGYMWRYG